MGRRDWAGSEPIKVLNVPVKMKWATEDVCCLFLQSFISVLVHRHVKVQQTGCCNIFGNY